MYNRGFLNKAYVYEMIQVHLDKSGSFKGVIPFPSTFNTVPYVVVIPRHISNAKITVSDVTVSSFCLTIENEGIIEVKEALPLPVEFSWLFNVTALTAGVQTSTLPLAGETATARIIARVKNFEYDIVNNRTEDGTYENYQVGDIFYLEGGEFSQRFQVRVSEVNNSGEITAIQIQSRGSYTQLPSVTFPVLLTPNTGVTGTGMGIRVRSLTYEVDSVEILNNGSGYVTIPTITVSPASGIELLVVFNESEGRVTGINVVERGSFSSNIPSVVFSDPPKQWAWATSKVNLDGDGFIEWHVPYGEKELLVGLTSGIYQRNISPVYYAFFIDRDKFYIREGSNLIQFSSVDARSSMNLKIQVRSNQVTYYVDDTLCYTSLVIPSLKSYSIFVSTHTENLVIDSFRYKLFHSLFNDSSMERVSSVGNQYLNYIYFAHEKL